ncbi:hypothetical protein QAD02_019995 [Eretmocerus hayati]|uniref:Uncharacterized protein n=1 Tax=Eretmocerus hayati TaxID=131215 RepID=A0ACC2PL92_9HYME|nr:hypothetical protein QAD02_019995 [Eretmocerus hayati]
MQRLEKLNSSIDIIPLQSQSTDVAARRASNGNNMNKPTDKARAEEGKVFRDPMIISRVRSYLYENEDKVYIDVTEMADYLQRKYRDYRAKKRGPFRTMVRRAYDEITENITRQTDTHWHEDEDEIDIESDSQIDTMPAEYLSTYKQPNSGRQNGNSSDKELIDISSDDDSAKAAPVPNASRPPKERMEVEPSQVSKRPHLCPSIDNTKGVNQRPQDFSLDMQIRSRQEKSRKRPRERDDDLPVEPVTFKKRAKQLPVTSSTVKFSNVGGNSKVLETVANLLLHIKHPEVYIKLGIAPPRGFLLHGPPGCGKTLLAHAIAGELEIPLLKVAAPELVAGVSGESEQRIRELFEQATAIAPCILFLDEIDAVAPHRATAQKEMERRIVSQLLSCLDELGLKENGNKVLVVGATNRPDSLDPALRRAGRFDREVSLGIPDRDARAAILRIHTSSVTLSPEIDLQKVASLTPGFVGADLVALVREAAMAAVNRTFEDLKKVVAIEAPPSVSDEKDASQNVEKPIENPVADTSDIIIEEEPASKPETSEPGMSVDKTDDAEKTDTPAAMEDGKSEIPSEISEPTEPTTDNAETAQAPVVSPPSESLQSESAAVTSATETATSAVAEADTAVAVTTEPPVVPTPVEQKSSEAPVDTVASDIAASAVEVDPELEQVDSMIVEEPEKKLTDILNWLHNEPPLSEEQLALLCVEERDFELALKNVQPSAKREGFATVPDVTWDDIGSLREIRQELQMTILAPIRHSEQFASLGLNTPTGVLLCGPPGCGKTLLAKAIANEAGINFISVKGPELLNMYVGESEKAVRQCFLRARNSAPCVIFFDELDSLCPKRSEGDSTATSRVVNQMLTEMDGVEGRKDVFLMAASNRPDIIDPAVLRPGRLDKILYVGLPNPHDRVDILRALTKNGTKPKLAADINLEAVAVNDRCSGYTGADLAALVREAGVEALREIMGGLSSPAEIAARHFEFAFDKVRPSVQEKDLKHYEKLQRLYSVKKPLSTDVPMSVEPQIDTTMEAMET